MGFSEIVSEKAWLRLMPAAEVQYSNNKVKKAGKALRNGCTTWDELLESQKALENWHARHSYPLSQFYESLSQFARLSSPLTNVVQRRKRYDAIIAKLQKNPQMQLTTMQDIAGCRAIVKDVQEVSRLAMTCQTGWANHELFDTDDYIAKPQSTGYRGIHLVYRFKSEDRSFNGLFVEIQYRSRLQHAWATAVEIIDLFQKQTLKAGTGDPNWQRFFALMGSAIAQIEHTAPVPNTPTGRFGQDLQEALRHYAELLNVSAQMRAYGSMAKSIHPSYTGMSGYSGYSGNSGYFVMELDPHSQKTIVRGYSPEEVRKAYEDVSEAERSNPNVVLVAAADFDKLKEAYPNWLIDTHNFLMVLEQTLDTDFW